MHQPSNVSDSYKYTKRISSHRQVNIAHHGKRVHACVRLTADENNCLLLLLEPAVEWSVTINVSLVSSFLSFHLYFNYTHHCSTWLLFCLQPTMSCVCHCYSPCLTVTCLNMFLSVSFYQHIPFSILFYWRQHSFCPQTLVTVVNPVKQHQTKYIQETEQTSCLVWARKMENYKTR